MAGNSNARIDGRSLSQQEVNSMSPGRVRAALQQLSSEVPHEVASAAHSIQLSPQRGRAALRQLTQVLAKLHLH